MAPAPALARVYILSRDGVDIDTFPDYWGAVRYLHRNTPYSAEHATQHEGWRIRVRDGRTGRERTAEEFIRA
jgi:hypothetical protein